MPQARQLRLRAQYLDAKSLGGIAETVRDIGAVQAQDATAELLAVRVRAEGVTGEGVERARSEDRSVARTWAMRCTLHLLPSEDVRWVVSLIGPQVHRYGKRHQELGLTHDVFASAVSELRKALGENGPMTRRQIARLWGQAGLPSEGQAVPHLLVWASLEGVICFGPSIEGASSHVLLDDWLGASGGSPPDSLAELARRHVAAYGPATPEDFHVWSGLSRGEARKGFAAISDELLTVDVGGVPMWLSKSRRHWLDELPDLPLPPMKMLGAFDPFLLGYRNRDLGIDASLHRRIHPGGGIIRATILAGGRAVATWTRKRSPRSLSITVSPFETLSDEVAAGIDAEVADIGRFLGVAATWERVDV